MYKIIASDLDGTLLRTDKSISKETLDVLKKLDADYGVIFLPSTGRTHRELPKVIQELPFLRFALTVNGGGIYDFKNERYLYEKTIDKQLALQVLEFVKNLDIHPSLVTNGRRMMAGTKDNEIDPYIVEVAAKGILPNAKGYYDLAQAVRDNEYEVQKMMLYPGKKEVRDRYIELLATAFPELSISSSGALFIEVNAKGIDKGVALAMMCEKLGISLEDTIAFGDAENDIPLLKAAGKAVVMANGNEPTKAVADEICESNDEDGLRKVLEREFHL